MKRLAIIAVVSLASNVRADDDKDIRQVLDDQAVAWNKGDLDGFMKGYWKSKDLTFLSGKDATRGWDETLERYKKRYQAEGKEMGKLTFSDVDVRSSGARSGAGHGQMGTETVKRDCGWSLLVDTAEVG